MIINATTNANYFKIMRINIYFNRNSESFNTIIV